MVEWKENEMSRNVSIAALLLALAAQPAVAQSASSGVSPYVMNTLFVVFCGVLVMWMAAGFAMLEAGYVRSKNVVTQCAKNIGLFAIASTAFMLCGYGLLLPDGNWIVPGILGTPSTIVIPDVAEASEFVGRGHSVAADIFFQSMFCVAVASIVSGAVAERVKLLSFFIFTAAMTAAIYPIQASWTWGGGFLATEFGFTDLAGSTVIHVVGGVAALTGAIIIGPRAGRFVNGERIQMQSYSLSLATMGTLILWMGWYGFNAGSYLSFSTDADASNVSRIFLNTNLAAAGGVITASFVSYLKTFRFDLGFMLNGALAGLVGITAEPLAPTPMLAFAVGVLAGVVLVWGYLLLDYLKIDDVVGAIPVHLFCGVLGTMVVPLSNTDATYIGQFASVLIVMAFVATATSVVWLVLKETVGVRVNDETEQTGIDAHQFVLGS